MRMLIVEDYIQIPWQEIEQIGANVSGRKISRHFEIYTRESKFLFASKDSGKILKIAREHLGNDKIVKLPTLIQTITAKIKIYLQNRIFSCIIDANG